jgi:hypothetical protein
MTGHEIADMRRKCTGCPRSGVGLTGEPRSDPILLHPSRSSAKSARRGVGAGRLPLSFDFGATSFFGGISLVGRRRPRNRAS